MLKKYRIVLFCVILQNVTLFSAQAASEDKKDMLFAALKKVEKAAAKAQEQGAILGYELPMEYKPAANNCMRMILGDDAPEKALLQDVHEEYDDLREALGKRPVTPGSKESVGCLNQLHETMQIVEYAGGVEKILKTNQILPQIAQKVLKTCDTIYVPSASSNKVSHNISDAYIDEEGNVLHSVAVVSESFELAQPSSCYIQ